MMRFLPLIVFALLAAGLGIGLTLNPREIPSALIGKPVPEFTLPPLANDPAPGLASADLRQGEVSLVNVFASWCVPCRVEHPQLMRLQKEGIAPLYGLNYKDEPEAVKPWLKELGNPFSRIGADSSGRTAIEWGVYGVPETFVVDGAGMIRCKHIGPLSDFDLDTKILPLVKKLKADKTSSAAC